MDDFVFLSPPEHGAIRAEWTSKKNTVERIVCPLDPGHARGGARLGQLDVSLSHRPKPQSIVWTWYGELLATSETVKLLKSQGVTGFEARPVTTRYRGGETSLDHLQEIVITGWGGLPAAAAGVRRIEHCSACGFAAFSCFNTGANLIDKTQWDGSDFFFVWPAPRFIIIKRRVAEILKDFGIVGWSIEELDTVCCTSQLTPGALKLWVDNSKLAELCVDSTPQSKEFFE